MQKKHISKLFYGVALSVFLSVSPAFATGFPTWDALVGSTGIGELIAKIQAGITTAQETLSVANMQQALGDAFGGLSIIKDAEEIAKKAKEKKERIEARIKKVQELKKKYEEKVKEIVDKGKDLYQQGQDLYNQGQDLYNQGQDLYNQGVDMYNQGKDFVEDTKDKIDNFVDDPTGTLTEIGGQLGNQLGDELGVKDVVDQVTEIADKVGLGDREDESSGQTTIPSNINGQNQSTSSEKTQTDNNQTIFEGRDTNRGGTTSDSEPFGSTLEETSEYDYDPSRDVIEETVVYDSSDILSGEKITEEATDEDLWGEEEVTKKVTKEVTEEVDEEVTEEVTEEVNGEVKQPAEKSGLTKKEEPALLDEPEQKLEEGLSKSEDKEETTTRRGFEKLSYRQLFVNAFAAQSLEFKTGTDDAANYYFPDEFAQWTGINYDDNLDEDKMNAAIKTICADLTAEADQERFANRKEYNKLLASAYANAEAYSAAALKDSESTKTLDELENMVALGDGTTSTQISGLMELGIAETEQNEKELVMLANDVQGEFFENLLQYCLSDLREKEE